MLTKEEICFTVAQADEHITTYLGKIKLERTQVSHTYNFLSLDWLVDNVGKKR